MRPAISDAKSAELFSGSLAITRLSVSRGSRTTDGVSTGDTPSVTTCSGSLRPARARSQALAQPFLISALTCACPEHCGLVQANEPLRDASAVSARPGAQLQ